jgi:hypothetical protein
MKKNSGGAELLPKLKSDLMQVAILYRMPYYEVFEIYSQVKDYVEMQHPDFAEGIRQSYIMKLTEINTKKVAIAKGRFDAPKRTQKDDE